jgi:hypothetical protein
MANVCSHGNTKPDDTGDPIYGDHVIDNDQCPIACGNCEHLCHYHVGQACDAGGTNHCLHQDCIDKFGGCLMWVEP